jgi:hypothetical protein
MKLKLSILLLAITFALQAQIPQHEVGIELGPNNYRYTRKFIDTGALNVQKSTGLGYTVGFNYQKNYSNKWSFKTGLLYQKLVLESRGISSTTEGIFSTVSIPVYFKYNFNYFKWNFFVGIGGQYSNNFHYRDRYYTQATYYYNYYISLLGTVGIRYKISDRINLGLELIHNPYLKGTNYTIGFDNEYSTYANVTNVLFSLSYKIGSKQIE